MSAGRELLPAARRLLSRVSRTEFSNLVTAEPTPIRVRILIWLSLKLKKRKKLYSLALSIISERDLEETEFNSCWCSSGCQVFVSLLAIHDLLTGRVHRRVFVWEKERTYRWQITKLVQEICVREENSIFFHRQVNYTQQYTSMPISVLLIDCFTIWVKWCFVFATLKLVCPILACTVQPLAYLFHWKIFSYDSLVFYRVCTCTCTHIVVILLAASTMRLLNKGSIITLLYNWYHHD